MTRTEELLDLTKTIAAELFTGKERPWEVLPDIKDFILRLGPTLSEDEFDHPSDDVFRQLISLDRVSSTKTLRYGSAHLLEAAP